MLAGAVNAMLRPASSPRQAQRFGGGVGAGPVPGTPENAGGLNQPATMDGAWHGG